ncbi:deoxyguanosinetriphosphate triphosphohydrolase [Siccirubricoccus sp. KC 17139]|uniref:Deoxyguanosinetriphosphate triphosphohydrolase-like protein n=1 Tax=Siccirubricoccus soli TaxID=2899147 RepID=A0ABT1DDN4_9PROT|nr:deoxyguanosinetriphosphate triphosphohydrolase [Siccirubricoccus soli]MCO6420019.1 deoxyguanosinetriphosphate triphosphohydrolase [Siccirubricoccus soli]MCP2686156.1 deoxyguanosinetriphosphate triphosphohydrolase [Siccirubricoccus soli]
MSAESRAQERAPWAVRPDASRGRLHPEPGGDARSPFQRDRDRIIHTGAFRRLQYKTQVFVFHEGDYFRTRLTHSIEVAQIARALARRLRLDEDLAEALALAHDLGHPPFGHAGEEALDSQMRPYGGFDHNAQSLKVVTALEARYAAFDGLNLSWETLEGLAKHNGPVRRPSAYLAEYDRLHPLELTSHASAEAQVAALADDIAYNNHDLDDGVRARLFTLEEAAALPLIGEAYEAARAAHAGMARDRLVTETVRRVINAMVEDVVAETERRIAALAPKSADDIRAAAAPVVAFSAPMQAMNQDVREFLFQRMYRHWRVNRAMQKSKRVSQLLFQLLHGEPRMLPPDWQARAGEPGSAECARLVCDYIAGMTDRFALEEHRRLTDPNIPG